MVLVSGNKVFYLLRKMLKVIDTRVDEHLLPIGGRLLDHIVTMILMLALRERKF